MFNFTTPLPVANVLLVVSATLFALALTAGVLIVHAVLCLILAGQLVGKATKG